MKLLGFFFFSNNHKFFTSEDFLTKNLIVKQVPNEVTQWLQSLLITKMRLWDQVLTDSLQSRLPL